VVKSFDEEQLLTLVDGDHDGSAACHRVRPARDLP
jgi:hypothetical protein